MLFLEMWLRLDQTKKALNPVWIQNKKSNVTVYISTNVVETCDVIIKFYAVNICSQYPTQSETLEE